jgi:hypothetical protein
MQLSFFGTAQPESDHISWRRLSVDTSETVSRRSSEVARKILSSETYEETLLLAPVIDRQVATRLSS